VENNERFPHPHSLDDHGCELISQQSINRETAAGHRKEYNEERPTATEPSLRRPSTGGAGKHAVASHFALVPATEQIRKINRADFGGMSLFWGVGAGGPYPGCPASRHP
jgi:hypothetical protein